MARLPRFVIPDHPQHVIVRGNKEEKGTLPFLAPTVYGYTMPRIPRHVFPTHPHHITLDKKGSVPLKF